MKFFIILASLFLIPEFVFADSYTTTDNLFENSYTNNLIDNKKYAIIQVNYDYYLIATDSKDVSTSGNTITMKNTDIVRVIRSQSGYNYTYTYSTKSESSTTIHANHMIVSNVDISNSVSSKRYDEYRGSFYNIWLLVIILGLLFALFLTKERSY